VNPKMLFVGPLKDFSGYASAARDYVRALDKANCTLVTRDLSYDGGNYSRSDREIELANRDTRDIDIVIQHTTPNEMEAKNGLFNVGAFCWETDRIPDIWVQHLNKMQLVLVPCEENLQVARRCGVVVPVEKVHYACDVSRYQRDIKSFQIPQIDRTFKFLAVCQYSKKKGLDPLLKAYLSEFTSQDKVSLILKTYFGPNDGQPEAQKMMEIVGIVKKMLRLNNYPPIHLIPQVLDFDKVDRLYATADCYCLPSRGEGWGVPHFDALGYGLPAIATEGTAPQEFITPECGWLVKSHMSPVVDMPHPHEFLYTGIENWHEPEVGHLKTCMREAYNMWAAKGDSGTSRWQDMQNAARQRVNDFNHDVIGPKLRDIILRYYNMWRECNVPESNSTN